MPVALEASEPNVGTDTGHLPVSPAARVSLPQTHDVAQAYVVYQGVPFSRSTRLMSSLSRSAAVRAAEA